MANYKVEQSPPALPGGFLSAMRRMLGDDYPRFLRTYDEPPFHAVRYRAKDGLIPFPLTDTVPWEPSARYLKDNETPGSHPLHEAGAYYLQEPSAMLPARILDPKPGETVLDLCAAPGGKSTQLAALMEGRGCLVCNEINPSRARILSRNIERMGMAHAYVTNASPDFLANRWALQFDKILVDAPCSGEGMFRKDTAARTEWKDNSPRQCAQRQLSILESAAALLRPGGRLIYSTCTLNEVENEGVIQQFVLRHPAFHLVPFSVPPEISAPEGMARVWPHLHRGEGHFAALLEKEGNEESSIKPMNQPAAEDRAAANLKDIMLEPISHLTKFGETIVSAPPVPFSFNGVPVLRFGLHVGKMKGNIFQPDHALALARKARQQLPLALPDVYRYLHGEVLNIPEHFTGWVAPTFDGWQLGWGKAVQGQLKNHYPKGLRK